MTATPLKAKTDIILSSPIQNNGWPEQDVKGNEVTLIFSTVDAYLPEIEVFSNARKEGKNVKITVEVID